MAAWRLEPDRVRGALRTVETKRQDLDAVLAEHKLNLLVLDVAGGGPLVEAVPRALTTLLTDQTERLTSMRRHIDAGVIGVGLAVSAYEAGSEEMATVLEREALAAADSGDLDVFAPHLGL